MGKVSFMKNRIIQIAIGVNLAGILAVIILLLKFYTHVGLFISLARYSGYVLIVNHYFNLAVTLYYIARYKANFLLMISTAVVFINLVFLILRSFNYIGMESIDFRVIPTINVAWYLMLIFWKLEDMPAVQTWRRYLFFRGAYALLIMIFAFTAYTGQAFYAKINYLPVALHFAIVIINYSFINFLLDWNRKPIKFSELIQVFGTKEEDKNLE